MHIQKADDRYKDHSKCPHTNITEMRLDRMAKNPNNPKRNERKRAGKISHFQTHLLRLSDDTCPLLMWERKWENGEISSRPYGSVAGWRLYEIDPRKQKRTGFIFKQTDRRTHPDRSRSSVVVHCSWRTAHQHFARLSSSSNKLTTVFEILCREIEKKK